MNFKPVSTLMVRSHNGSDLLAHNHGDARLVLTATGSAGILPCFTSLAADIIQQQHTRLVAGQQLVLPCLVLDSDAHTVTVGVSCQQQQVSLLATWRPAPLVSLISGLGYGQAGEVSVRLLLLLTTVMFGILLTFLHISAAYKR